MALYPLLHLKYRPFFVLALCWCGVLSLNVPASPGKPPRLRKCSSQSAASLETANHTPNDEIFDVAILGSGPASCSLAALLAASSSSHNPNVVLVSKFADKRWVPNYGCWTEEWQALDRLYSDKGIPGLMERGVDIHWCDTDCFFGEVGPEGVFDETKEGNLRRVLGRPYLRLSRDGLKSLFYDADPQKNKYKVIREDVEGKAVNVNVYTPAGSVVCHEQHTEIRLKGSGNTIKARIVVDGTGAESPFVIRDGRHREGYQIAYGVECRVDGLGVTNTHVGDYDRSKMTLFDFRSQAWRTSQEVVDQPTFNYVMPLAEDIVFFEETSLVANPAMSFAECQQRLKQRLQSQNVEIVDILEEEFCYIPMGGGLPRAGQRLVPIGAAAGLVHPATGYQLGRALASNVDAADQILKELESANKASFDPDVSAARILARIWTPEAIRQRNFAIFGGEYFMNMNVFQMKQFFAGFFRLQPSVWGGFLAGWKHLPGHEQHNTWFRRLSFGLTALATLPWKTALEMVRYIFWYAFSSGDNLGRDLIQSVTPLAGQPEGYEQSLDFRRPENQGDENAKEEALTLLCACDRCEEAAASTTHKESETETLSA